MVTAVEVIEAVERIVEAGGGKPQLTLIDLLRNTEHYNRLQSKTQRVPPPHQDLRVIEWKFVPRVGMRTLIVTASVESGTPGKPPRKCVMQFFDVEYAEDVERVRGERDWITITTETRTRVPQVVAFKKIDAGKSPVQVRCSCEDFYFRFAWYLKQKGSLYGRTPRPYHRKTTTRPSVNIHHIPAMCKHLWNLARALVSAGVVVGIAFGGVAGVGGARGGQVVTGAETLLRILRRAMGEE